MDRTFSNHLPSNLWDSFLRYFGHQGTRVRRRAVFTANIVWHSPFFAFAESLNVGTLSLISNRETISSSIIPFELLVLRDVIVANVNLIVGMLIIVVSAAFVGNLT